MTCHMDGSDDLWRWWEEQAAPTTDDLFEHHHGNGCIGMIFGLIVSVILTGTLFILSEVL